MIFFSYIPSVINASTSVNTWIPSESPEEAHIHLNPTCCYVVDMDSKICQTSKTVTNHITTKQLADANMASPSSLDMYRNKHPVDIGSNCGRLKQINQMDIIQVYPMNRGITSIMYFLLTIPFIFNTMVMNDCMKTKE